MSAKSTNMSAPGVIPASPSSPSSPPVSANQPEPVFCPSEELGNQLQHLEETQAEIDRRRAEELARLREIQDRD